MSAPFILAGTDAEGDSRESGHSTLESAVAIGRDCMTENENGPAWLAWSVWGNHPETEEWQPLATSETP